MMRIRLITITHKTPAWIQLGYEEYAKRLPASCALEWIEIPAEKRPVNADIQKIVEREGKKLLAATKPHHHVIALDVKGKPWTTKALAQQLALWRQEGRDVDLLVGGPDGLSSLCLQKAAQTWSLSPLTFPHGLVRVIVAEQIYRAWSILEMHPYHR